MEILNSRIILRPADPEASVRFYRDTLGLAIGREFPGGTVFYLGQGLLEVSGHGSDTDRQGSASTVVWLQVRDLAATAAELAEKGVTIDREPRQEPWGLHEMWVRDPDGVRLVFVEVPADHPLRRDTRS
ncbi:VOC family protein [Rhodococcus sp. X156]|uniref:VOC family protein n=1 Tax=Rhodococcus sp. X156 TaxID=2499145 RepID=UPI000FD862EB|nr:VOC family protein [Rhodococcus sp. X156]